ncbi:hypothetical protein SH449x_003886 [Pirellulaceae bacterium SH449]
MLDYLRLAIAVIPLGLYFAVIGMFRIRRTPTVISRPLDVLLLGMACLGLVAVGPLELFFPRAAYSVVGNWIWLVLLSLYALLVLLTAFHIPPGIVIYGASKELVRGAMETWFAEKEEKLEWLGDSFRCASTNIQGQIEEAGWSSVTQVKSVGKQQNLLQWIELDRALHIRLAALRPSGMRAGAAWFGVGVLLLLIGFGFLALDVARLNETLAQFFDAR